MDNITVDYLRHLKDRSNYSCTTICSHSPQCSFQLGSYFCRLSFEDASLLLKYNSLKQLYPSLFYPKLQDKV